MFVKLALLACSVGAVLGVWNGPLAGGVPAHQFPAGVSPQACPNFPHCTNPSLAANPNAPAPYNGGYNPGAYNQGAYNPGQWNGGNNQNALDSGTYTGDGDWHGEGLAESGAYGNVDGYDNNPAPAWNGAPAWNQPAPAWNGGHQAAAIPAGVDPGSCPNYPFCH